MANKLQEYNEEEFLSMKKEMQDKWKNDPINKNELKDHFSLFFLNKYEDFTQNCLLIQLLQFQHYFGQTGSPFIVPYFRSRRYNLNFLGEFSEKPSIKKFTDLFTNPIIINYFWNITFPNLFGSFFSNDFCAKALVFLSNFIDNQDFYSVGVISFIKHNYLFQNTLLNVFYTSLNSLHKVDGKTIYGWCQHDQKEIENIFYVALKEATQQLYSNQITALNTLFEKYKEKAKELIFSDIILYNLKYVWPYSSYFLPNEMLKSINENYVNNEQPLKDRIAFLDNFIPECSKLTSKVDFRISYFVSPPEFINVTNLDLIFIYSLHDRKPSTNYPNIESDSNLLISLKNKKDQPDSEKELIQFMLSRAFKYHRIDYVINSAFEPEPFPKIENQKIQSEWMKHEEQCKRRNEHPLAIIYSDQPFDKELAFYGLYMTYHTQTKLEEYKNKMTSKIGCLIPIQTAMKMQDSLIEMSTIGLSKLLLFEDLPEYLKNLYTNHIKNYLYQFIRENMCIEKEFDDIFHDIYERAFKDQIQGKLTSDIANIKDFAISKKASLILFEIYKSFFVLVKDQFVYSETVKNKNKSSYFKGMSIRDESDLHSFKVAFYFIRKIEYPLIVSYFLNNPQEFSYDIDKDYLDGIEPGEYRRAFDTLDKFGVFSYIESACYCLYNDFQNQKVNYGKLLVSVPTILEMVSQFFYTQNDSIIIHPCIKKPDLIPIFDEAVRERNNNEFVHIIFKYATMNENMSVYSELINEFKDNKINVIDLYVNLVDNALNGDLFNYQKLFSSIKRIYEDLQKMRKIFT